MNLGDGTAQTAVERYWNRHVVCDTRFGSARESEEYLGWRFKTYPLFREFSGLHGDHDGEVVLDYGCGPGNDLVGFAIFSRAKRIIGVDVSDKALSHAKDRLALHGPASARVELLRASDAVPTIPLPDDSVDYVSSQGVLHMTSHPERLLCELYRVLKPGGRGVIMVYNRHSLWLHLYTAYQRVILENAFPGLTSEEAFARNVDGEDCPVARCYAPEEFLALCRGAGFEVEYVGGYLSETELEALRTHRLAALADSRLPAAHRRFLSELEFDARGFPLYRGHHAGIGGVYRIYAWSKADEREWPRLRAATVRAELADVRAQIAQTETYYAGLQGRFDGLQRHADEQAQRIRDLQAEVGTLRAWEQRVRGLPLFRMAQTVRRAFRGSGG